MKRFSIIVLVLLGAIFLVSMVSADSGGSGSYFVGLTVPFAVDYQAFRFSDTLLEIPLGVLLQPDTLHRVSSR